MKIAQARLEIDEAAFRRLDDELTFGFALDLSLPLVRRHHRCVHIHARGQPLAHECSCELICTSIVRHRCQHENEIDHFTSCTFVQVVVLCERVSKDERRAAPKRRVPQPKRPPHGRRIIHWAVIFIASLIVVNGLVGDRGLVAMLRARHEYDALAANLARQRAENARLREEARRLREDPAAIEEVARRELGLIRPGERVFIIKNVEPPRR